MSWYLKALKKYVVFSGRAQRKEYWLFFLFNLIIELVLMFIDNAAGLADTESGYGPLSILYTLAVLLPGIAVSVRRLHDTTHSGWWLLIGFIPLLGWIVLLYWYISDGTPGANEYGAPPA